MIKPGVQIGSLPTNPFSRTCVWNQYVLGWQPTSPIYNEYQHKIKILKLTQIRYISLRYVEGYTRFKQVRKSVYYCLRSITFIHDVIKFGVHRIFRIFNITDAVIHAIKVIKVIPFWSEKSSDSNPLQNGEKGKLTGRRDICRIADERRRIADERRRIADERRRITDERDAK